MGCGSSNSLTTSQPATHTAKYEQKIVEKTRTDRKYQRINGRFQSGDDNKMQENVTVV